MTRLPTRGSAVGARRSRGGRSALRSRAARRVHAAWAVVLAHPWPWLAAWSVVLVVTEVVSDPKWLGSWFYIRRGVLFLLGPHALTLYAAHPELQMGPLTFLVSAPLVLLPPSIGLVAAAFAMQAAGLLALREVRAQVRPGDVGGDRRWFVSAALVMVAWTLLAVRYGHPDDVLALLGAVVGLRLLRSGAVLRAALLFGLAIDCKPWIAPIAFVLLAAPRDRWLRAALVLTAVVVVVWLPFLVQPGSLRATGFTISVDAAATIRLLGLADQRTPMWCRPAQLLIGSLLVAVVARRRRPEAALLVVVVVRLLLDPSTHLYYASGALLGGCLLDVGAVLPVAAAIALVGVQLPPYLIPADYRAQAVVRLVALLLLGFLALVGRRRRGTDRTRGSGPPRSAPALGG